MKRVPRLVLTALGIILLIAAALALEVARFGGVFRGFAGEFPGQCATIALGGSAEDLRVDRQRGVAYLSILDRAAIERGESASGSIMLLDLNVAAPAPRAATSHDPPGFRPHGISLLQTGDSPSRLFAISHQGDGSHSVEIFEQGPGGGYVPRESLRDAAFDSPNALAAVGPRQFYLVNDGRARGKSGGARDAVFRVGRGTLLYFDGSSARIIEKGLKFPAGIAANADGTRVYVGEALGRQLRIYVRDIATGALALEEIVPLDTAPDNLDVDAEGVVWIAAHPKLLRFLAHVRDPGERAPTQVLRFDPRKPRPAEGKEDSRLTPVYGNDGAQISAGTVAAHWRDEFLVGALHEPKVLICKPSP